MVRIATTRSTFHLDWSKVRWTMNGLFLFFINHNKRVSCVLNVREIPLQISNTNVILSFRHFATNVKIGLFAQRRHFNAGHVITKAICNTMIMWQHGARPAPFVQGTLWSQLNELSSISDTNLKASVVTSPEVPLGSFFFLNTFQTIIYTVVLTNNFLVCSVVGSVTKQRDNH